MSDKKTAIEIPEPLYKHIEGLIQGSGFNSVTDFVVFVLRDVVYDNREMESSDLTPYEERRIRDKLKLLGYL